MGCDIHFYVEKWSDEEVTEGPIDISDKRDSLISNVLKLKREYRWISVDKWYRDEGYWTNYGNSFYSGRNYELFAKLADVRNYANNIRLLFVFYCVYLRWISCVIAVFNKGKKISQPGKRITE